MDVPYDTTKNNMKFLLFNSNIHYFPLPVENTIMQLYLLKTLFLESKVFLQTFVNGKY